MAATSRMRRRWGSNARKGIQFQTGGGGEGGSGRGTRKCYKGLSLQTAKGGTQGCGIPVSALAPPPTSSNFFGAVRDPRAGSPPCCACPIAPIGKAGEIFLGHVAHWRKCPRARGG